MSIASAEVLVEAEAFASVCRALAMPDQLPGRSWLDLVAAAFVLDQVEVAIHALRRLERLRLDIGIVMQQRLLRGAQVAAGDAGESSWRGSCDLVHDFLVTSR